MIKASDLSFKNPNLSNAKRVDKGLSSAGLWRPRSVFVGLSFLVLWWGSAGNMDLLNSRTWVCAAILFSMALLGHRISYAEKNSINGISNRHGNLYLKSPTMGQKLKRFSFLISFLAIFFMSSTLYFKVLPLASWDSESHFVKEFYQQIKFYNVFILFVFALPSFVIVCKNFILSHWGLFQSSLLLSFPLSFSLLTPEFFFPIFVGLYTTFFLTRKTTVAWGALYFSVLAFFNLFLLRVTSWS